ncbi:MAG: outer membrane beta-barrel protein [Alloprevotella sp.]|nr:outer membrane beta-barrel protein [Alloprevotella sp.]
MKKLFLALLMSVCATSLFAGGIMTNTNYHIAFDRMMARGASLGIDAAYSNPAGLVWGYEGWQLSFNWQRPHQDRDITTTFPLFTDPNNTHKFRGKASAPFVPGLFAAWHKDKIAVSAMIGIVGSGGYVKYDDGLPMLSAPVMALMAQRGMTPDTYTIDASMKGKQYVFGGQVSFAYRFARDWSASVGVRANYYDGYYRGHLYVSPQPAVASALGLPAQLAGMRLDTDQTGWGFNPIVGLNYHRGPLTVSARYEFRTKLNIPNKTNELAVEIAGMTPEQSVALLGDKVAAYRDGAKTRYDSPALLVAAVGYEFRPNLRATLEYHFFDDKHAHLSGERQKALTHGTQEFLAGIEWDINKMFTVSAGAQRTDYGLSDDYQQNTSFACDSWSVGLGGAININKHLTVNVGYFWTMYSDYTVNVPAGTPGYASTTLAGTDVYSRTNRVLGLGIDYKF